MRREVLGMKQEELAEHVNLSPNYISAIERGENPPDWKHLSVLQMH